MASPFFTVFKTEKTPGKLYQKNAEYDSRPGPISEMKRASSQIEKEILNHKKQLPHCGTVSQILIQLGPGLEYILKGSESLWMKSISEIIISCRYY